MDNNYHKLLTFLHEAEKLKSTLRHNWMTSGRQEDSSQHSWRAALLFIIANDLFKFDANPYKTLVMLFIHDLPELKYGDIAGFIKNTDMQKHADHKKREMEAARELYSLLPQPLDYNLTTLQEEFEKGESKEAKVAQALEKIESQLQHQESGPQYWSKEEYGEHMLHYPDKAINALNNDDVRNIWKIIYDEIYKLTFPDKQ
jgi:putative hydrolases of HD superfamily